MNHLHQNLCSISTVRCSIPHPTRRSIPSIPLINIIAPRCYIRLRRVIMGMIIRLEKLRKNYVWQLPRSVIEDRIEIGGRSALNTMAMLAAAEDRWQVETNFTLSIFRCSKFNSFCFYEVVFTQA